MGVCQADGGHVSLGIDTGAFHPIIEADEELKSTVSWLYGLHVSYGISEHANIQAGWSYTRGPLELEDGQVIGMGISNILIVSKWYILTGVYRPLVFGGISYYTMNFELPLEDETAIGPHLGGGMEFAITRFLGLGMAATGEYLFTNKLDWVIGVSGITFINFTF